MSTSISTASTGNMQLIAQQSLNAAATANFTALTGKRYLLNIQGVPSIAGGINIGINGIATGTYSQSIIKNVAAVVTAASSGANTSWITPAGAAANYSVLNMILSCDGVSINMTVQGSNRADNEIYTGSGVNTTASTSISQVNISLSGGTFTGIATLYALT